MKRSVVFIYVACLLFGANRLYGYELIRNGDLAQVLYGWGVDPQLESKMPYSKEHQAIDLLEVLDDMAMMPGPTLTGTMVYQPLNVMVQVGEPIAVSMDVRRTGWMSAAGHTVALYLEYLDSDGDRHRFLALNPDNDEVPDDDWESFSESISVPESMVRLVGVTLDREGEGRYAVRNISVTAPAPNGILPKLRRVTPIDVAYGDVITLVGEHFGENSGVVMIGGCTNGVSILDWDDNEVQVELNDASIGGKVVLETRGARTWNPRTVRVTSPYHTVEVKPTSMMHVRWDLGMVAAIEGQQVRVAVYNRFFNGFEAPDGLALSVLEPISVEFSRDRVYRHGGTILYIDTTGLTQGVHTITIQADDGENTPRTGTIDFFVHEVASTEFGITQAITQQGSHPLGLAMTDVDENPIGHTFFEPAVLFRTSDASILEAFNGSGLWTGNQLLVHDSGVATLTATLPNGSEVSVSVTNAIPDSPRVVQSWMTYPTMQNIPVVITNTFNIQVSDNFGRRNVTFPSGIGIDGNFIGSGTQWGYRFHLWGNEYAQPEPGRYLWRASTEIGSDWVSAARIMTVVNDPSTALFRGRLADYEGETEHSIYGTLELYDASTGDLMDTRDIHGDIDEYVAARIVPGSYRLRWVSWPDTEQWYPNATTFDEAETITVVAGEERDDLHFVIPPPSRLLERPALPTPQVNPDQGVFSITIPAEYGNRYQLYKSTLLQDHTWYPVGWEQYAWDDEVTLEDDNLDAGPAFYRVRRLR